MCDRNAASIWARIASASWAKAIGEVAGMDAPPGIEPSESKPDIAAIDINAG